MTGTTQVGWRREKNSYYSKAIYLREHLSKLKEQLDDFMGHERLRYMYISGPPGSGKTTYCLFYFMLRVVEDRSKKGLLVQYRAEAANEIMIVQGGRIRRVTAKKHNEIMPKLVDDLVENEGRDSFDFCVFDGVRQSELVCKNISSAITNSVGPETKVIKITSLEFDVKGGDSTRGIEGIACFFVASSWKLEDYKDAVKAKLLRDDELDKMFCLTSEIGAQPEDEDSEKDDIRKAVEGHTEQDTLDWLKPFLERKYFYAGGSARFMFDYSFQELVISTDDKPSVFDGLCERMKTEDWQSFAELKISASTKSSVSSGMQRIDTEYIPVSKYFLHMAHKKCKETLTASVRAAAESSQNPALKGWAFELEQLDIIGQVIASDNKFLASEDRTLAVPLFSRESATFDGMSILVPKTISNSDCFTIWCSKWNQGCFDVAFYVSSSLMTMNFTISNTHSLKIDPLRDLMDALVDAGKEVSKVTHIAVVEDKRKSKSFSFQEPEGTGRVHETTQFLVDIARSDKLVAQIGPRVTDQPERLGHSLGQVKVYQREWKSCRKRKKTDYSGQA